MKLAAHMFMFLIGTFSGCVSTQRADAHTVEFKRICFPHSKPLPSESTADTDQVLDPEQMGVLFDVLQVLKQNPIIGARVVGFADKDECLPRECRALSLRRAEIVFDWLIERGVPAEQLRGPFGESLDWPLDSGGTAEGQALNRRVQLEPYSLKRSDSK